MTSPDPIAQYQSDHDLLVTLNERMANLIGHVESMVASNKTLADDHETRIRELEQKSESQEASARTWRYALSIAITILTLAIAVVAIYHK